MNKAALIWFLNTIPTVSLSQNGHKHQLIYVSCPSRYTFHTFHICPPAIQFPKLTLEYNSQKKGQIHSFILTGPEWPWTARGLKVRDCKTQSLTVGWHDDDRLPSNFSVLMDINHFWVNYTINKPPGELSTCERAAVLWDGLGGLALSFYLACGDGRAGGVGGGWGGSYCQSRRNNVTNDDAFTALSFSLGSSYTL